MAQTVKYLPAMWETWVRSPIGKIPWRRGQIPTAVFWPGESHGQRSLAGYSSWGRRVGHDWATFTSLQGVTRSGNWQYKAKPSNCQLTVLKTVTNIVDENCGCLVGILIVHRELMNKNRLFMYMHWKHRTHIKLSMYG